MRKLAKETILVILVIIPFVYLAYIWESLPQVVPIHFSTDGPDGWGDKSTLILTTAIMAPLTYVLLTVIPIIDPKKRLKEMGAKYYNLKLLLVFFMCVLSCLILYTAKKQSLDMPNLVTALIGALFAGLGNYFQTVRPNYFIGIRTPWTLENEEVWRSTHRLGGRLWLAGGVLMVLLSFLLSAEQNAISMLLITAALVIIPVAHSYLAFQKNKKISDGKLNE